jgi:outer membrane immunogenic protein
MRRLTFAFVAAVSTVAITQIASAADMARPAYKAPPPVPQDWSGFYVGLEGGYAWGRQNTDSIAAGDQLSAVFTSEGLTPLQLASPIFFPDVALPSTKQKGWLFGGFFGAQKQWGSWVLGIEGDIDGANIKGSGLSTASSVVNELGVAVPSAPGPFTVRCPGGAACLTLNHDLSIDSKIDMLASLRGKVGWSVAPNWLIYGTGGAAFAHVENTVTSTQSFAVNPRLTSVVIELVPGTPIGTFALTPGNAPSPLNASGGTTMFGWAAGGGVDWKVPLDSGSAFVFGVQYLHYGFPEQTITLSNNGGGSFTFKAKESVDTVKGRISYLFSIH